MDERSDGGQAGRGGAERTRQALLDAGLKLFGRNGFDATSTRDIAALAGANIGSIAYHFGGKEGLRTACAGEIVRRMRAILGESLDAPPVTPPPEMARAVLEMLLNRFADFMIGQPEAQDIAAFVMRETANPSEALDIIYGQVFEPAHRMLCVLFGAAMGAEPESEATRLTVFTVMGQVLYFRIARPVVARRMDWGDIGPDEAARIRAVLLANLNAILTAGKAGQA